MVPGLGASVEALGLIDCLFAFIIWLLGLPTFKPNRDCEGHTHGKSSTQSEPRQPRPASRPPVTAPNHRTRSTKGTGALPLEEILQPIHCRRTSINQLTGAMPCRHTSQLLRSTASNSSDWAFNSRCAESRSLHGLEVFPRSPRVPCR